MSTEKDEQQQSTNRYLFFFTIAIGVIGGIFWSTVAFISYYFHFVAISPAIILTPFAGKWHNSWLGVFGSLVIYGGISILVSLVYYAMLRKRMSIWASLLFGFALSIIAIFILSAIYPKFQPLSRSSFDTLSTIVCLYVLYGVFIGTSISYEAQQVQYREVKNE